MSRSTGKSKKQSIADQLTTTDKLLVLLLFKLGATQTEIGHALGVSQGTVSEHFRWEVKEMSLRGTSAMESER